MADMMEQGGLSDRVKQQAKDVRAKARDAAREAREKAIEGVERTRQWMQATGPRRARPLFGVLPVLYLVPQDVHSVADYATSAGAASTVLTADSTAAKVSGVALGSVAAVVSMLTDYRLSVAKLIPIEAHEVADYVFGLGQIAAPFLFGYWKRDRLAALTHIIGGAMVIGLSMVTDYRAQKGVGGGMTTDVG